MKKLKIQVFWATAPRRFIYIYRRFGTLLPPSPGPELEGSKLLQKVGIYTRMCMASQPTGIRLHQHCCETLKSRTNTLYVNQARLYVQLHSAKTNVALLYKTMILFSDKQKDQFCGDAIAFLVNILTTYRPTCSSKNFKDGTTFKLVHSCKLMK
jgi:hypothetical protein